MVETKFMTMYRGRRNFKFIFLVPRGVITCTNFTERNFGRVFFWANQNAFFRHFTPTLATCHAYTRPL